MLLTESFDIMLHDDMITVIFVRKEYHEVFIHHCLHPFSAALLSMCSLIPQPVLTLALSPPRAGPGPWGFPGAHSCHCPLTQPFPPNSLVPSVSLLRVCSIPLTEVLDSICLNMGPWMPQILSQNLICILKILLYHRANRLTHLKSY